MSIVKPAPLLAERRTAVRVADIPPDEGRMVRVGSHLVAVFHLRSGEVRATQPRCPHRGGPLADGLVGAGTVVCPLHGRTFDLESGAAGPDEVGVATVPARLDDDGTVVLALPADGPLPCLADPPSARAAATSVVPRH